MAASSSKPAGTTGTAGSSVKDLEADIQKLRDDISLLTKHLKDAGDHSLRTARKAASEGAEHLRAQGEATIEGLRDNAKDLEVQLTSTVREKPITSLALAAGVGFLLAVIMRR
ncbi:ElaB/YqjD/DUF883 family membrane-anchored ribosome-binding protein [Mesorhizobium sp. J18]|uniref:DUF883 family protein n=1 Tax=Mesorhizobium sp. J18 TaxID=935263 RepID=UPI00119903C0|nr:DUF883 family protein [Mesorhizobium sp. J18]TWG98066.1 ElaB/YqjD/DUF883 family membrane-anchored ribosome-binding protein [Mesorhizobium sp. J18]